jgi:hypothetical protein
MDTLDITALSEAAGFGFFTNGLSSSSSSSSMTARFFSDFPFRLSSSSSSSLEKLAAVNLKGFLMGWEGCEGLD